jgi:subfamily B ATP-binding cassette protein MsbA
VRAFVRLVSTYVRPYWQWMLLAIVMTSRAGLSNFLFVYMGKVVVDDILEIKARTASSAEAPADGPASTSDYTPAGRQANTTPANPAEPGAGKTPQQKTKLIALMFLAYVTIWLLITLFRWVSRYKIAIVGQKIVFQLRSDLHAKLQSLQMTYFDQVQTGKLMARVIDDVSVIRSQATGTVIQAATSIAMIIVGCILLFTANWRLAAVATACLPAYGISYQVFARRIREFSREARRLNASIYGLLHQKISGVRVVKSFVRERGEMLGYHRLAKTYFRVMLSRAWLQSLLGAIAIAISAVGTTLVIWYGAVLVRSGDLTPGSMLFFYGTVMMLFGPVIQLVDINVTLQHLSVVISRVFQILDEEVKIKDHPDAVKLQDVRGLIEFHNVSLAYEGDDPHRREEDESKDRDTAAKEADESPKTIRPRPGAAALHNVDLKIKPGELVCVMGASGSGKSSLVNLIPRLYEPSQGKVTIDGVDTAMVKLTSLRRHIGLVPQESAIFSGTIADNIRYGAREATIEAVIEAAKAAEIHDWIQQQPDGYNTAVGEQGVTLSGGQKQRISIARALITHPSILLLDDCTSALDAKTEARIQATLSHVLKDHTSIVITHRASVAAKADKIVVVDEGRIVEEGTHDQLLERRSYYWRIFNSQQKDMQPAVAG